MCARLATEVLCALWFYFRTSHWDRRTKAEPGGGLTEAIVVVSELKAWVAQAVVGADSILTGPVSTRMPLTLIHIYQEELNCYLEPDRHL